MDNPRLNEWSELRWRRPLRADELAKVEQLLATNPQALAEWADDAALDRCLDRLGPAVVSSNFTARVLQQVRAMPLSKPSRFLPSRWIPAGWLPRMAFGALMVCLGMFSAREYQVVQRARMSREMATVSRLATLPPMDWLKNFDTIDNLSRVKVADEDLLAALR